MTSREEQFSVLYRADHAAVLGFLARRCSSWSQAEDLTHEVFLVAWRKLAQVPRDPGEARGWLLAVARNHLRNLWRSDERQAGFRDLLTTDALAVAAPPDEAVAAHYDLATAWRQLGVRDQEAIALTAWDGLSSEQAGQVLGITAAAYRRRLHRARVKLHQAMSRPTNPNSLPATRAAAPNAAAPATAASITAEVVEPQSAAWTPAAPTKTEPLTAARTAQP